MIDDLDNRFRRVESAINSAPQLQLPTVRDTRVPPVIGMTVISTNIAAKLTGAGVSWISPADPAVDHFEVWVAYISNGGKKPYKAAEVKDSPARFNIVSTGAGTALVYVITVMKNGLRTETLDAPTKPITVF